MTTDEAVKADPQAEKFSLEGTPVLSLGRYDRMLARADNFQARVKVYFEGGENASHTHLNEDHLFFVVAGQATFHLGRDGEEVVIANRCEGVMLPRGSFYRFLSSGEENLVMLRVGARGGADGREVGIDGRIGSDGLPLEGNSDANHHVDAVEVPGEFFKVD